MSNQRKLFAALRRIRQYLRNKNIVIPVKQKDIIICFLRSEGIDISGNEGKKTLGAIIVNIYENDFNSPIHKSVAAPKRNSKRSKKDYKKDEPAFNDRRKAYNDYINSSKWAKFRLGLIEKRGKICQRCGIEPDVIHAHHLTYERFGEELEDDILLVCVKCHEQIHGKKIRGGYGKKRPRSAKKPKKR